ncbi:MAG: substrate-binding domain-containing protein, partial [Desulfurococcaceae archaeon]
EIALWSDPKIKELNPELADALPSKRIIAVYRADSSGTTEIFTTFLYKSAPSAWSKELVGKKVAWPVEQAGRSVGAQGNPGVVQVVLNSPYSIGYVELSYAVTHGMRTASLQNREGVFVQPTVESMQEAARNVSMPSSPLDDFSRTLDEVVFTPGEGSYPASSFTYVFLWKEYRDKDKESALSAFLRWVAGEGYGCLVDGYAPPPPSAVQLLLKAAEVLEG